MTIKTHLMVHHSLTKDGSTVSWDAIRRYHQETLGWLDIGYHLGVELIGDHYEMLVGRPLLASAAAAYQRGMNRRAVHVCFVGNYDERPPPIEMLQFAAPHLADLCDVLGIEPDRGYVMGHREVADKTCPGKLFDLDLLIQLIRGMAS